MSSHSELSKISKITDNLYLSGIIPLDQQAELIKDLKIKYIVSCVDREYVSDIHDKLLKDNQDLTILYLPYIDVIDQNLWSENNKNITMAKYVETEEDYNNLIRKLDIYDNKPLIEIGYHFINDAISKGQNVLIHCMAGISRSVSTLSYYLMKKYHLDFNTVLNFIKDKRQIVNPNISFKSQLQLYQEKRENFTESDGNRIISNIRILAY